MFDFLPYRLKIHIEKIDVLFLQEIRLRISFPIICLYKNTRYYLTDKGLSFFRENSIYCNKEDIDYVVKKVTENSLYAYNDRIKEGYLTTNNGIRLGFLGECVFNSNEIVTIKSITSINVRIPHEAIGFSKDIIGDVVGESGINNTLIISPPLLGKTTLLKDLIRELNKTNEFNVLVVDERGEFVPISGENIDAIRFSTKSYAVENGVRVMSPSVIVMDELMGKADWKSAERASFLGVNVIASCHGKSIEDVVNSDYFVKGVFKKAIVLERELDKITKKVFSI